MTEDKIISTPPKIKRRDMLDEREARIANKAIDAVAYHITDLIGEVSSVDIKSKSRKREVVMGRHMVAFMLRQHAKMAVEAIGGYIKRNHATVIYGEKIAVADIETNPYASKLYMEVCAKMRWVPLPWLKLVPFPSTDLPGWRPPMHKIRPNKTKFRIRNPFHEAVDEDDAKMGLSSRPEDYVTPR